MLEISKFQRCKKHEGNGCWSTLLIYFHALNYYKDHVHALNYYYYFDAVSCDRLWNMCA